MLLQDLKDPAHQPQLRAEARLSGALREADAVVIGAGAGLSASAGFTYAGARFSRYFGDFEAAYGFHDMYTGGFYPYRTPEERWAYWSRYIWVNRYLDPPEPVYRDLLELVQDKEYFVLTTNVDHCFQKAGFEKERFFTPRGTTACSSARNPAAVRPGTTGRASAGCWRNSADCASPQNGSPGVPDAADLRP